MARSWMQLNYNHLYYFHIAAVEGTVAAAATRLGITAATVSEQLRALERVLGAELFERLQTGLKLTDAGRLAFQHTSVMFRLGDRLLEFLGHPFEDSTQILRVGVSIGVDRSISAKLLVPLFGTDEFFPVVRTADTVELLRDLRAGLLDLILCDGEPPEPSRRGLEIMVVDPSPMVAIAPPNVTPSAQWQDVGIVVARPTTSFRRDVDAFLEARGLKPRLAGEADDSLVLVEAATRAGLVTVVPASIAREAIAAGRLRVLEEVPSTSAVHAICRDSKQSAIARRAVEIIVDEASSTSAARSNRSRTE